MNARNLGVVFGRESDIAIDRCRNLINSLASHTNAVVRSCQGIRRHGRKGALYRMDGGQRS